MLTVFRGNTTLIEVTLSHAITGEALNAVAGDASLLGSDESTITTGTLVYEAASEGVYYVTLQATEAEGFDSGFLLVEGEQDGLEYRTRIEVAFKSRDDSVSRCGCST